MGALPIDGALHLEGLDGLVWQASFRESGPLLILDNRPAFYGVSYI